MEGAASETHLGSDLFLVNVVTFFCVQQHNEIVLQKNKFLPFHCKFLLVMMVLVVLVVPVFSFVVVS